MFLDMSSQNKKLIKILQTNDIRISKKGNICLNDFVDNIIESKNSNLYMKRIPDKIVIKDDYYITSENCLEIMKQAKSKKCKKILYYITKDDDNSSIIDPNKNIFQYQGHKFLAFFVDDKNDKDNWQVWVKGSDVAKFLGYVNTKQAIIEHIENKNKNKLSNLLELFPSLLYRPPKNLDHKTIFINLSGFFNLIHSSKKPIAKSIRSWIDNDVLPALVKHGSYSMQSKLNIKLFYDDNAISAYYSKAVIYIGYIGIIKGEHTFKYGLSRKMFERDHEQHSKFFQRFDVVYIGETDNCEQIESLFEKDLKAFHLYREHIIKVNKGTTTELFTVSSKHTIESLIDHMKKLVQEYKLPAIKEANNKIDNLTNVLVTYKQSDELRKLELEYRLSDNYKLELQRDIKIKELDTKIKEIDSETRIVLGNIEIDLQREKNKQIAMEKGYDLSQFMTNVDKNTSSKKKKYEIISI